MKLNEIYLNLLKTNIIDVDENWNWWKFEILTKNLFENLKFEKIEKFDVKKFEMKIIEIWNLKFEILKFENEDAENLKTIIKHYLFPKIWKRNEDEFWKFEFENLKCWNDIYLKFEIWNLKWNENFEVFEIWKLNLMKCEWNENAMIFEMIWSIENLIYL